MIWVLCLLICIGVIVISVGIGIYFYRTAFYAHSDKSSFIRIDSHNKLKIEDIWYLQKSKYKHVSLHSEDGLLLHGSSILHDEKSPWVVLVHGYMGRLEDMIPYAKRYYDLGYAVLLVDLRGHGKSEGDVIGFGCLDAKDIEVWCTYLKRKYAADRIVLHGVSMGAATVLMCCDKAALSIVGIVEDCSYATLKEQLRIIVKKMIPFIPAAYLLFCLSLILKHKAGYRMKDANTQNHVRHSIVPILFIHGERDDFIPVSMSKALSDACTSDHDILLIARGRHAANALAEPKIYWDTVKAFLNKIEV